MAKKKATLPQKSEIVKYWVKNKLHIKYDIFIDIGEPTCMACGKWWGTRYDDIPDYKGWDLAPLERCHIVPESLGGSSDCDNIILMCKSCHKQSPDTKSINMFFRWVKGQNYLKQDTNKIEELLKTYGVDANDTKTQEKIITITKSEKFKKSLQENSTLHFGEGLKYASFVAHLVEFMESD